jgi:hypothetical protein
MRKAEQEARAREEDEKRERELERERTAEQERATSDEMLAWGAEFWGAFGGGVAEGMAAAYAAYEEGVLVGVPGSSVAGIGGGESEGGVVLASTDTEDGDPAELEAEVPQVVGPHDGGPQDWDLAVLFDDEPVEDFEDDDEEGGVPVHVEDDE